MALSRSAEARRRAHREEGRVATGLRSRASSVRQLFHGVVGIACWVAFIAIWLGLFVFNRPESWPLILTAIISLFVIMLVLNAVWVAWNRRIYWRHNGRRRTAVVQETRFDSDVLGRTVIAPPRDLLMSSPMVSVGVDADDNKLYEIDGVVPVDVPAEAHATAPLAEPVAAVIPAVATLALPVAGAVRIDRTPPSVPVVVGGSDDWRPLGRVELRASGSLDTGSGLSGYQWRASVDGGLSWTEAAGGSVVAVDREGETLVQFRALDHAGNASEWTGQEGTVRQRVMTPPVPHILGTSAHWVGANQIVLQADAELPGGFVFEHRLGRPGGEWSAPVPGAQVTVLEEGETRVAFRSAGHGMVSDWAETMVRIDRTGPSTPRIEGLAHDGWSRKGGTHLKAAGSTDALSGVAGYQYRFSLDGGATWSTPEVGAEVRVEAEGLTLVQFRAFDGAGNPSAWSPEVTQ